MNSEDLKAKILYMTEHSSLSPEEIKQQITSEIISLDLARHAQTKANLKPITFAILHRLSTAFNDPVIFYKSLLIVRQLMQQGPANITLHFNKKLRVVIASQATTQAAYVLHMQAFQHLIENESNEIEALFVRLDLTNEIPGILRETSVPISMHKELIDYLLLIDSVSTQYSVLNEFELKKDHVELIKSKLQTNEAISRAFKEMIRQDQCNKNSIFVYFPSLKDVISGRKLLHYFMKFGKVKRLYPHADNKHATIYFEDSHVKEKWIQMKKYKTEGNEFLIYENKNVKDKQPAEEIQPPKTLKL